MDYAVEDIWFELLHRALHIAYFGRSKSPYWLYNTSNLVILCIVQDPTTYICKTAFWPCETTFIQKILSIVKKKYLLYIL